MLANEVIEYRDTLKATHAYGTNGASLRARNLGPGNGCEFSVHSPGARAEAKMAIYYLTLEPEVVRQFAHGLLEMVGSE